MEHRAGLPQSSLGSVPSLRAWAAADGKHWLADSARGVTGEFNCGLRPVSAEWALDCGWLLSEVCDSSNRDAELSVGGKARRGDR